MKSLLMVTSNFYPATSRGGPAVSITNLAKVLSTHYSVTVITSRAYDKEMSLIDGIPVDSEGSVSLFGCKVYYLKEISFKKIYKLAEKINPDIVYTSSIFSAKFTCPALYYAKKHKSNVKIILSPRGELMPKALLRKQLKKTVFLAMLNMFKLLQGVTLHVTSEEELTATSEKYPNNKILLIKNIVDICPDVLDHPPKMPGYLKIISVGRIHPIKNVDLMIETVGKCTGQIEYCIYGPEEDKDYYDKCVSLAQSLTKDKTVKFCGMVNNLELKNIYAQSHVYLSLTQTENFGISIVEGLSYSCPVVISNNTPWHFDEKEPCGYSIDISNIDAVVAALNHYISMNDSQYRTCSTLAHQWICERMKIDEITAAYLRVFG